MRKEKQMASKELHELVAQLRAQPLKADRDVEELRAGFAALGDQFPPPASAAFERIDAGGVPGEWVSMPNSDPSRVLLYFHGGGYVFGSAATHRGLVARLCQSAATRALSLDYRLAPEHRFPAAVEDAVTSYRWLLAKGIHPKRIAIAGDSAGGGLTLATLVSLRDQGVPLPAAAVCISPRTDLANEGRSMETKATLDPLIHRALTTAMERHYLGPEGNVRAPLASPLYAELAGLPPLLILVGDWEVLLDDSTRFAEQAKVAGVEVEIEVWEEMIHGWPFFAPLIPEAREAIDRMGTYIRRRLA
jgi:acetyl esterase/lipase